MKSYNQNWGYPFSLISGQGLGSSVNQISLPISHKTFGLAQLNYQVNVATGNMIAQDRIIKIPDLGGPIEFSYIYNSIVGNPASNWKLKVGRQIKLDNPASFWNNIPFFQSTSTQITVLEADGHGCSYILKEDGCYYSSETEDGTPYITFNKNENSYSWHHPKLRITETFDAKGILTKRIDALGNETLYEYDDAGELKAIVSSSGTRYEIRRNDQLVQIYLIDNKKVETLLHTYQFENGNLKISKTPDGHEIQYQYDDINYRMKSVTQSDGSMLQFGYYPNSDSNSNKLKTILVGNEDKNANTFIYSENSTSLIDAVGIKTTFKLNTEKRVQDFVQSTQHADKNDIIHYDYTQKGQVERKIYPDLSEEKFEYNESGFLIKQVRRDKTTIDYTYSSTSEPGDYPVLEKVNYSSPGDDKHEAKSLGTIYQVYEKSNKNNSALLRYKISSQGRVKEYTYTSAGLIESEHEYPDIKDLFQLTGKIPSLLEMEKWKNEEGRLARRTSTHYTYDDQGRLKRKYHSIELDKKTSGITGDNSPEQLFNYDILGYCTELSVKQSKQDDDTHYLKSTFSFGSNGNLTRKTIGSSQTTSHEYKLNKIITSYPNDRTEIKELNSSNLLKNIVENAPEDKREKKYNYEYDESGHLKVEELPDGNKWISYYDKQNRPRFTISPEGAVKQIDYNNQFRYQKKTAYSTKVDITKIKSEEDLESLWVDDDHPRDSYEFYNVNEKIRFTTDAEHYLVEYQYDDWGNLSKKISYAEKITAEELEHLKKGNDLIRNPSRQTDQIISYFYDRDGYKIAEQNPLGYVTRFERDSAGRITKEIHYSTACSKIASTIEEILPSENPEKDAHHHYFYNSLNQCTVEVDAEGYITTYTYHPDGQKQTSIHYENPATNWINKTIPPEPLESKNGNDQETKYFYDELGRKKEIRKSNGEIIRYKYDKMNNLIGEYSEDANNTTEKNINGDTYRASEYKYDDWGQIIAEADPLVKEREKKGELNTPWKRHQYNEVGLKIKSIDSLDHATLYYYSLDGHLVLTIDPTGAAVENSYNAFGELEKESRYHTRISLSSLTHLNGGYISDEVRKLIIKDPSRDAVTQLERDRRGQIVKKTDPEGNVSHFQYNAFNQCERELLPAANNSTMEVVHNYDSCNNEVKCETIATTLLLEQKNIHSDSIKKSIVIERKYDHFLGKQTEIKNELGARTKLDFDKLGRTKIVQKELTRDQFITDKKMEYDAFHRIVNETNADSKVTTIEYKQKERLRVIQSPIADSKQIIKENIFGETIEIINGEGDKETMCHAADGQITQHTMGNHTALTQYNVVGLKEEEIDSAKVKRKFSYNEANQLTKQITDADEKGLNITIHFQPNALGQNELEVDARAVETKNEFNRCGYLTKQTKDPLGKASSVVEYVRNALGDEVTRITGDTQSQDQMRVSTEYDSFNRLSDKVVDPNYSSRSSSLPEALEIRTQFLRDAIGNVIKEIDPNNNASFHFYDLSQQKMFSAKPLDKNKCFLTEWKYTKTGKISETRTYSTPIDAKLISESTSLDEIKSIAKPDNKNDSITQYFYDDNDREIFNTTIVWNAAIKKFQSIVVEKRYDKANRVTQKICYYNFLETAEFPEWKAADFRRITKNEIQDRILNYWYDTESRVRFTIDQYGAVEEKRYDAVGRLIAEIFYANPCNDWQHKSANELDNEIQKQSNPDRDRITYKVYDSIGREIFIVNPDGTAIRKDYDENNNITQICKFKDPVVQTKDYDTLVNLLKARVPDRKKDAITNTTYDNLGHISSTTDALGNQDRFERNVLGQIESHTDRSNHLWQFRYDRANRLTEEISPKTTVAVTTKTDAGKLNFIEVKTSITKKTDFDKEGNATRITEGIVEKGVLDEKLVQTRAIEIAYNPQHKIAATLQPNVMIDDESKPGSLTTLPEKEITLQTKNIWDTKGNKIVEIDESGIPVFNVYDNANRLILKIDRERYVTQYSYNSFDQPEKIIYYATKLHDLSEYKETGLTPEQAFEKLNIQTSQDDRIKELSYDRSGRLESVKTGSVFYYSDGKFGQAQPETKKEFSLLSDCTAEYRLISPGVWSKKFTWYDKCDRIIAEVDENNYLTFFEYGTNGQVETKKEFSKPLLEEPKITTTIQELNKLVQPSPSDRIYKYSYDLLGQKKSETIGDVTTETLELDEKTSLPFLKVKENQSLTQSWEYSPTQKETKHTFENGTSEYKYYDERDLKIAETEVSRTSSNTSGEKIVITPLTVYKQNVFGQVAVTQTSNKGGTLPDDKGKLPQLIVTASPSDTPAQFIQTVALHDNRGLVTLKQDAELHVAGFTYTTSHKIAREIHEVSTFKRIGLPTTPEAKVSFEKEKHIDETKFKYDARDRTIQLSRFRDNQVEREHFSRFNGFNELTGECIDGKSWNSYKKIDRQGNPWFTYDSQGGTIKLCDLQGAETLQFQSGDIDLQTINYNSEEFTKLLSLDLPSLERTETTRDTATRVLTRKFPIWFKDKKPLPTRTYKYGRWNLEKETDSLGNSTDYEHNHRDQIRRKILPEVTVVDTIDNKVIVDAQGQYPRRRPETLYGHNDCGFRVGIRDANNHTHGDILDEAGQAVMQVLGDGTATIQIFNALKQIITVIDARGQRWNYGYDLVSNLVFEDWPIKNFNRSYQYNEVRRRIVDTDAAGNSNRYNHDTCGNIVERYLPLGQCTQLTWDHNKLELTVTNPDGDTLSSERDYFGVVTRHKDLKGRITVYENDFKRQPKKQYLESGEQWGSIEVDKPIVYQPNDAKHEFPAVTFVPRVFSSRPQNIIVNHAYGLLKSIEDKGLGKSTTFQHDTEGRPAEMEVKDLNSGQTLYFLGTTRDEMGREKFILDKRLSDKMFYSTTETKLLYDCVSNRRNIDITLKAAGYSDGCYVIKNRSRWNLFDPADRNVLLNGIKTPDNRIVLAPNYGIANEYKQGFRFRETRIAGDGQSIPADIDYNNNGQLKSTIAHGPKPITAECSYSNAGYLDCYAENFDGKKISRQILCNENGWLQHEITTDSTFGVVSQLTTLESLQCGLPKIESFHDRKDSFTDERKNTYFLTDSPSLCIVTATRTTASGTGPASNAQFLHDSNAALSGKIDSADETCGDSAPAAVCIDTLPQGWLMNKQCILYRGNLQTNYLRDITGKLLGGYTSGYMDTLSSTPRTSILIGVVNPGRDFASILDAHFSINPLLPDDGIVLGKNRSAIMYFLSRKILRCPDGNPIYVDSNIPIEDMSALPVEDHPILFFNKVIRERAPQLFDKVMDLALGKIGASKAYVMQKNHLAFHTAGIGQDIKPDVGDIAIYSTVHSVARIYPTDPIAKNNPLDWNDPQLMSQLGLQTYIVSPGDTFKSIAKKLGGDARDALKIARCNGFISHHHSPKPGLILRIPQLIQSRNNIRTSRPDHDFMRVVGGVLSPFLRTPNSTRTISHRKPKQGGGFWGFLVKAIAITLVCIAAPHLAVFLLPLAAPMSAGLVMTSAVIAAIGDAAVQGLAIKFGESFSLTEMFETAVTVGIGGLLKPGLRMLATNTLKIGTAAVATQLAEMATGLRNKFDAPAIVTQITASVVSAKINDGIDGLFGERTTLAYATKAIATPFSNAVTGNVITHTPLDVRSIAANALGTAVGSELGGRLNDLLKPPAQPAETSIPDIEIDVRNHKWSADLSDLASRQRQARLLQSEAKNTGHSYLLDSDRQAKYKSMLFGNSVPHSHVSSDRHTGIVNKVEEFNRGFERIRDNIVSELNEFNPLVVVPRYAKQAYNAFSSNNIKAGLNASAGAAMCVLSVIPAERVFRAGTSVVDRGAAYAGNKLGFFDKVNSITGEPLPYTLSDVEARKWYHNKLAQMLSKIDNKLSLKERALQIFKLRNDIKLQTRELMANQELARSLPPPKTLREVALKAYEKNLVGDKFWEYIIDSAQRTNKEVDDELGVINNFALPRHKQ